MAEPWLYSIAGLAVGFVVGLTGIGGGALMTPLLVLLFGVAPQVAVGTDLMFAAATKVLGTAVHGRHGTIDWPVVRRLAAGSLPAAALTVAVLAADGGGRVGEGALLNAIGAALLVTAVGLLLRRRLQAAGERLRKAAPARLTALQPMLTVAAGVLIGVLVAATSVGAGVLGTVMLVYLYPYRLTPARLVGTDLAHALPLGLIAGLGHLAIGNVDFALLGWLLAGSVPGVLAGSLLSTRIHADWLAGAIALVLLAAGVKLLV